MHSSQALKLETAKAAAGKPAGLGEVGTGPPKETRSPHWPSDEQVEGAPVLSVRTVTLSDQDQMLTGGKSLERCEPVASVVPVKD